MNRNDYRRAFIMLRPSLPGYSGHVRLERRTMMGSMYFTASGPEDAGELQAALAGQRGGEYSATALGALRRDRRGQASLPCSFDPRDIAGRPLEGWQWVVIARVSNGGCEIALTGNVNGSRELDPEALRRAVCALYARPEPAADLPGRREAPEREAEEVREQYETGRDREGLEKDLRESAADIPAAEREEAVRAAPLEPNEPKPDEGGAVEALPRRRIISPSASAESAVNEAPPAQPEPARESNAQPAPASAEKKTGVLGPRIFTSMTGEALPRPRESGGDGEAMEAAREESAAPAETTPAPPARPAETAARKLGLDVSRPWADAIEPLRELFAAKPPIELPFDDDFVYVRAGLPEGCGFPGCLIGMDVDDGQVEAVRYAIPARYAVEPPAGLEDYVWVGGAGDGFWVLTVDPRTGRPMPYDD